MNNLAQASSWRKSAPVQIEVVAFKPLLKNTLRGFVDLRLPQVGIVMIGATLHEKSGSRWIGLPARPYAEDGATKWAQIIDFASKDARAEFQRAALAAIDASGVLERGLQTDARF